MRILRIVIPVLALLLFLGVPIWWYIEAQRNEKAFDESEPDMPKTLKIADKEEYLRLRTEHLDMLQGFDTAKQDSRTKAIQKMEEAERALARSREAQNAPAAQTWRPLGPAPIPVNGSTSYSGRVSAIAVHPTNPNIVYVGTAQGGLYRSLNGGTTWTPLMDGALTLAIGAVAIAPSDPTTVFVGTGESTLCGSGCFIGVGLYRITNADTTPVLSNVLNKDGVGADIFTGRAVSEVIVHPTDANIVFVTTTSGIAGIGSVTTGLSLPAAGLYRTTNALSASPVFEKIAIQGTNQASRSITDMAIEPGNMNRLVVGVVGGSTGGTGGDGGIYLSTDALAPTPTFTRTLTTGDGSSPGRVEFAANKTGSVVTFYAASGTANGTVYKSIDGGMTFNPLAAGVGFCGTQCFYDIAIAVDQADANKVYLGGSPARVFGRSIDGGGSYTNSSTNLHVDTQAFAIAPSDPNTFYFGSDGGIWKTTNVQATPIVWQTLNNTTFSATQFMGITLHPFDRHYALGGTQDNGTEYLGLDGATWVRSDGGDGGFAYIDKNPPTAPNYIAVGYHTYFNQTNNQIGYIRALTTEPNGDPFWSGFRGCQGTSTNNGIQCGDATLFYAPMVGGPGAPNNTLYFGTTRLYRSADVGLNMSDVSGILPARISAIAIAPQSDDLRLVGLTNGQIFRSTTAGATTMSDITGSIPGRYVGRIMIDPTNSDVAYVALNGYGIANHVWKTTNLQAMAPTWSPAGNGIPDTPTNALAIDPANPQTIWAGTDIGVFMSTDGGANWQPFSSGLPRVAVFGMEFQPIHRVLKIATHGRGFYEFTFPSQRIPFDFDNDGRTDVGIFRPAVAEWWINQSSNAQVLAAQFGATNDRIVPADYTGDRKSDIAVWRPSTGEWFVLRSEDYTYYAFPFGANGDTPMPGDYDGDGAADAALFRPSNGTWFILNSGGSGTTITPFGTNGDRPVAGDYDGDNKADIAIYRPGAGQWWLKRSTAGIIALQFGNATDVPIQGDYTGDAKTDVTYWRPSTGEWFVLRSENFSYYSFPFGTTGDIPSSGDYDGDGRWDPAVFRPSNATWFVQRSSAGVLITQFGTTGDKPIPSAYVP